MTSIKKLAMRGAVWTIVGYGAGQLIRLVANPILASFLDPTLLGLSNLMTVFIMGLGLFSDVGLGPSIIQNKRGDDPDFYNTAWTMQIVRGFLLWMGCIAIAWPVYNAYRAQPHAEQIVVLLPIVGFGMFISSFESTGNYTMSRHMQNAKINLFALFNQVFGTSTVLIWASITRDIWSLILSGLVSQTVHMLVSHRMVPEVKNRFRWDPTAAKEIFSFGKWIFFSTATTFLADQVDRLMLGRLASFEVLGVYGIAYAFSDVPRQVLGALSQQVLFPAFAKLSHLPREEFRERVLKPRLAMLLIMGLCLAFFVCFGDIIISGLRDSSGNLLFRGLYNQKYAQAAWMLPLLAFGIWPRMLTQTTDKAFYALGKPQAPTFGYVAKFIFMLIAMPIGYHLAGIPGTMLVIMVNDLPYYVATSIGLQREGLSAYRQDMLTTLAFFGAIAALAAARWGLGYGLSIGSLLTQSA